MAEKLTRICEECGDQFQVSKFQPYIRHCKKHRSKKKYKLKPKHYKLPKRRNCCEPVGVGIYICPTCQTHWWSYGDGWYRKFHPTKEKKYQFFFEGKYMGSVTNGFKEFMHETV